MAKVVSVGVADAPYKFNQTEARDFIHRLFSHSREDIERLISVFDNSTIEIRHFTQPREWFSKQCGFKERNDSYIRNACSLSKAAVVGCMEGIGAAFSDFDHMVFVSSTGISTPSIDAMLINELRLDVHLKRTPIWGLGCVGGAVGLSRALEYTTAFPEGAVLLIALEVCSMAFHRDDYSKSHIVATALFSDGAAAALIVGRKHRLFDLKGINLIDSHSTIYYDSLDVMGWEIADTGFKVIFSKDIPSIVRRHLRSNVEEFIGRHGLAISDIKHFVVHPGGPKVISSYKESLDLPNGELGYSRKVLREHGNMSSPTVLYVLKEFLEDGRFSPGDYGLISALGPGFSLELLLFQTS